MEILVTTLNSPKFISKDAAWKTRMFLSFAFLTFMCRLDPAKIDMCETAFTVKGFSKILIHTFININLCGMLMTRLLVKICGNFNHEKVL